MAAFWATRHRSLWPLGLGLTVVAAGAMWRNDPTVWFADNRFEQYDDPSGRLASMFTLWDSGRGLGTIRTDLWIGTTVPLAVLRGVGLPIGVTQHIWHGALLVLGGVGAASFLRCFRPRIGLAHVITAGVYMLGPYSAGFLSPSNLYVNYAVAPWIFVIFHRGIHDERRWRWPAVLALVLLALGTADLPGEFFVLVYLVPIALYAVHVDRTTTWVRVGSWVTRSLLLGLLTMAGPLYALFEGREFFAQRLRETELATSLSGNSSWAESWRGLGGWLLYFRDGASFARPQTLVFLTGAVAILVSFIPPLLSVIAVGFLRHRDRLLMGAMVLTGVTMMVALFPADDPSPYGRALEWLFDNVPQAALVRSSYKAGSGAMWGMAALSGISIAAGWHHVRAWEQAQPAGDRLPRASVGAIVALGLLAFAVLAQPFWRTGLYDDERLDDTPAYVDEAMEHLDELPGDGRLLFVPGTNRSQFRWGHVNDDILDASLSRPQLVDVPVHRSAPIPADILDAVDDSLVNGRYENGMITRYAARLGIDHVVIRNDFTWEDNEQPRPASYRDLRADPGLELVATFGRLGENTTSPLDAGLRAEGERLLAPIEVFRVRDPGTVVHLQSATAPLLVAGDGAALPAIARRELAATDTSLRFTGEMDGEALTVALEAGSPLLVTDTNRRTLETIATQSRESFTLSPDAELDRDLTSLFPADGAQTVASYGPASTVGNAGESDPAGANQPWYRPALAVDGDPRTEWRSAALDPVGEGIRVEWSVPAPVGSLTVTPAVIETSRREINELRVTTSAGEERIVAIGEGPAAVALGGEPVDWVEVTAASVRGPGGDIGIVDIELDGDPGALAEWIVLPDDVARAADELPALADALSAAPVGFAFERLDGDGPVPVEAVVRRIFALPSPGELELEGVLALDQGAPESVVAAVAGGDIRAEASSRLDDRVELAGAQAVDGDPTTGWIFDEPSASIALTFPERTLDSLTIDTTVGTGFGQLSEIDVLVAGEQQRLDPTSATCDGAPQCEISHTIELGGVEASSIDITMTGPESTAETTIRVDEIRLNGQPNDTPERSGDCVTGLVEIDGEDRGVRFTTPPEVLLRGQPARFVGCVPVALGAGSHRLRSGSGVMLDRATLLPPGFAAPSPVDDAVGTVESVATDGSRVTARVDAADGGVLVVGQSYHPAWRASADGRDLGRPLSVDGLAAWQLEPAVGQEIVVEFGLQRRYEAALLVSLAGALGCCVLVVGRRQR